MHFLDKTSNARAEPMIAATVSAAHIAVQENSEGDVDYAINVGRGFEALKYAASLLTGTLLLDLVGSERTVRDQALTQKAQEALAEAQDHILSSAPRSDRARHHKHHLIRAFQHLTDAASRADQSANLLRDTRSEEVFQAIRSAWSELEKLGQLLKGFYTVDLSQSCCAYHAEQMARFAKPV